MESESAQKRIITARPGVLPWMGAGFCWVMAVLMPVIAQSRADYDDRGIDWGKTILALLFWAILGLLPALHGFLSRIIANTDGLRWRVWHPWKPSLTWQTAPWEDIADFYDTADFIGAISRVETRDGRRLTFGGHWREYIPLREVIAERAIRAESAYDQNGKIAWMPKGARPAELPVTFVYTEARIKKLWLGILTSGIGFLVFMGGTVGLGLLLAPARSISRPATDLVAVSVIMGLLGLGLTLTVGWSLYQEGRNFHIAHQRRKKGEEFLAERDGLTIWREGEARKILWEEIVGYEFPLYVSRKNGNQYGGVVRLRTRTGEEYSFTPLIDNYDIFAMILRQYATDAVEFRRDQNDREALGGIEARWSGGEEGKGERVFHRRTRSLRGGVLAVYVLFALTVWVVVRLFLIPFGTVALPLFGPIALLTGILAWYVTVEYLRDRVLVGTDGITHINKHGWEKRMRWDEIERIWTEGNVVALGGKDGSRIQLITTGYAYGNELPTLLTERLSEYRYATER